MLSTYGSNMYNYSHIKFNVCTSIKTVEKEKGQKTDYKTAIVILTGLSESINQVRGQVLGTVWCTWKGKGKGKENKIYYGHQKQIWHPKYTF